LTDLIVLSLENINLVSLVFVVHLLAFDLVLKTLDILFKLIFLVIEFVLQCEEMFIQRDAVSEEGLIA
jgi:hypothetical protein